MPITVNQTPSNGQSAHYDLWHVVNTDLVGNPTLKVVFEVFIGGVLVYTAKVYPPPGMGTNAFFNAHDVIKDYCLSNYFTPANSIHSINTNSIYVEYQVKYGEEWTTSTGTVTGIYQQATSTHTVYNCYPKYLQEGSLVVMPSGHVHLSDRDPSQIYFAANSSWFVPYLRAAAASNHFFFVKTYNASGTIIGSIGTGSISSSNLNKLSEIRASVALIQSVNPTYFTSATEFVGIECGNGTIAQNFEVMARVWCHPKFDPIALHFLNRYGGYETMIFGLVNKKEVEFAKTFYSPTDFKKASVPFIIPAPDPSVYVGSATNYNSTTKVYNPTKVQRSTRHMLKYRLTSDFVTETNYNWLLQLLASPSVYMESNGYFYPVVITDNNWGEKKANTDKMFNLELTVEGFSNVYSQYQ